MKNLYKYGSLLAVLLAAVSCQERHPALFQDMTGVYFNNRSAGNVLVDNTEATFVYETANEMDIPVKVQLIGRPADFDRTVNITFSSSNAEEGKDFRLPEHAVLPAGASSFDYVVTLLRTEPLKENKKSILLEILSNEYFTLPVTEIDQVSGTVTTLRYRIDFSDMFTEAPKAWEEDFLGTFSQQKFELIIKVMTDVDPADFNDASQMSYSRQQYISYEMTKYIQSEQEKGDAADPDIFDSEGKPLSFRK